MRRLIPSLAAIAVSASTLAHAITAQVTNATLFPVKAPAPRLVIELETRERWMNARQMAIHTPTTRSYSLILIDPPSADASTATRVLTGIVGDQSRLNEAFRLTMRPDGHFGAADIIVSPVVRPLSFTVTTGSAGATRTATRTAQDSARTARMGLTDQSGIYMTLTAPRLWDAVPMFNPRPTQPGATWIDTISYATTIRDFHQSLTGLRRFTILRDTTVAGRQLWVVRDSATVDATEQYPTEDRSGLATVERRTRGFIVGNALYDSGLRLFRARHDSTALRGEATLRYSDGRVFTTPTRYERTRIWTMYDPAELAVRSAQLSAQSRVEAFSLVREPRNPLEERVADGNKQTIDSLYSAWTSSRDADQRLEIKQLLAMWAPRDAVSRARLRDARIAEGDTVYLVENVQNARYDAASRLTMADAQLLLPLMRDPGLAFQHGLSRDIAYERVVEALTRNPPAIERDTSKWACEPAACQLFAEQWKTASEPRLKSVGLAVLTLMNPRQWRDTFLVHAGAGDVVLQLALPMVEMPVARKGISGELPAEGAPWTAWRDWVRGPNPPPDPVASGRGAGSEQAPWWLMSPGNPRVLRFFQAATGRDIAGELLASFRNAANDTVRVLFANILAGIGALPWTTDSAAKYAMSPSSLMRGFAARLIGGFATETPFLAWVAADSALNDAIHDQLLMGRATAREPWASVEQKLLMSGGAGPFQEPPSDAPGANPVFYRSDSLSVPIRVKFVGRLSMMPASEWWTRPVRQGGEMWSLSRVSRSGQFARITVEVLGQNERAAGQSPQAWASRTVYYLMLLSGQWMLVTKWSAMT